MAPKTIAVVHRQNGVDPVSPIRDDYGSSTAGKNKANIHRINRSNNNNNNSHSIRSGSSSARKTLASHSVRTGTHSSSSSSNAATAGDLTTVVTRTTKSTGRYARAGNYQDGRSGFDNNNNDNMMDPTEYDAWLRLGGEPMSYSRQIDTQNENYVGEVVEHEESAVVAGTGMTRGTSIISRPSNTSGSVGPRTTATTATAEETLTTQSTVSSSSSTTSSTKLRQSVRKHEQELQDLKSKYEEAKTKMNKMKTEKNANKKLLLEMSGLIKALQDISVDYEKFKSTSGSSKSNNTEDKHQSRNRAALDNVQRKIQAIDTQMKAAKIQCGMLQEEKTFQSSTIKAQESQIISMEDQIKYLVQRLEQQSNSNTRGQGELERIIQLQETQIWSLEGQISILKKDDKDREIRNLEKQNAAKYEEINSLEDKLAALREAQNTHKIQASLLRASKSQDSLEQATVEDSNIKEEVQESPHDPPTEIDERNPASSVEKPTLHAAVHGKSARKKCKTNAFGIQTASNGSSCNSSLNQLAAISEECESEFENQSVPEASVTSASDTAGNSTSSSATSTDGASTEGSCTSSDSSPDDHKYVCSEKQRTIALEPSEDGSVEVMSLPEREEDKNKIQKEGDTDTESDAYESSAATSTKSSSSGRSSSFSKSCRSILTEIQEETDKENEEKDEEMKHTQIVRVTEKTNPPDWDGISADYSVDTLEKKQENGSSQIENNANAFETIFENQSTQLSPRSTALNIYKLQEENETLRKKLEEQVSALKISEDKYEKLYIEHSEAMKVLSAKQEQYNQLVNDSSNLAELASDIENYSRLEKMHEAVVMKLADLGEENDMLEKERDAAKEQLQKAYSQLQSYDDVVSELNKLKTRYKVLQDERDAALLKVERLQDQHRVLKEKYASTISASEGGTKEIKKLRQENAEAKARIEVLEKSNEEFENIEDKFTASEVRVTMLEKDLEKARESTKAIRKKQVERESQLKEVIEQYKDLKRDYVQKEDKLKRLESVIESDMQILNKSEPGIPGTIVTEKSQTERTSSNKEVSAAKVAAMTAQMAAYEEKLTKLQKQRDAAMREMKTMEDELEQARKEAANATDAKKTRENDLRIVLQHYEKLQTKYEATSKEFGEMAQKYEDTVLKIDVLEQQMNKTTTNVLAEKPHKILAEDKREEKTLSESAESFQKTYIESEGPKLFSTLNSNQLESGESNETNPSGKPSATAEMETRDVGDDDSIVQLLADMKNLRHQKENNLIQTSDSEKNSKLFFTANTSDIQNGKVESETKVATGGNALHHVHQDLRMQLQEEKESAIWKNEKIARVLCDLKQSQDQVHALMEEKSRLQSDLNLLKGHLLIAQKESNKARERQDNRENNLRNAIAKHHRLQQAYESLEGKFDLVQEQLSNAQKEIRLREEETKEARKRASAAHTQYKRLEIDNTIVLDRLEKMKQELQIYKETSEPLEY